MMGPFGDVHLGKCSPEGHIIGFVGGAGLRFWEQIEAGGLVVGDVFAVGEVDAIRRVGTKMVTIAGTIRDIKAQPGFTAVSTAMPGSALAGACSGKDVLLADLLSRASGRVEQIGNACTETGVDLIDTEEESAGGFRSIGEF